LFNKYYQKKLRKTIFNIKNKKNLNTLTHNDIVTTTEMMLLIIMAFLPPIIYVIWIRNTEKINREKWLPIIICFIWGATIAIIAALILEIILEISLIPLNTNPGLAYVIPIVIIAPFAEELTKPLALKLKTVKKELDELEDGLIYGAVAGLGFSATENLLYGYSFLAEGFFIFMLLMIIRSFGGCLLHASATAWTGFGYGKVIMKHQTILKVIPYFILAFIIHAVYNSLLVFDIIGVSLGLLMALSFALITIMLVRNKIKKLDQHSG
jgi:RsiW-degrading membrane proteinase PrsW (M82 family)